ncbi:MAG TPA: hypothetical protein VH085_13540 [Nocardioides sp.]|nr:hypothetical protein [Nocardioides sp.]
MSEHRPELTRTDLPEEFTPETVRRLPISVVRRLSRPGNGVLRPEEQASFDAVVHEVMSETAGRVSRQLSRSDWATVLRDTNTRGGRRGGSARPSKVDEHVRRLASRIDQQVDVAEALAPGVDWSFAQPGSESPAAGDPEPPAKAGAVVPADESGDQAETVSDLEQRLTEQVELVEVMSEIADVSKRTYELEQQRDLQNTRGVFFGFVVSVAVLVAGWAPVVAADDWGQRVWILCLTVGTCVVAGAVYALIRTWQNRASS